MASLVMDYKYLSEEELEGFDKYEYNSIDTSPLSNYVMHPFWDRLVKIFPLWVPANLLTLSGWLLSVLSFVVVAFYDPEFRSSSSPGAETVPNWVWLLGSFCIFWAHQLDGCDGKQAKRTNSSSPLGELFDHGLDSSAVWLMGMGILSIFGVGENTASPWELTFILCVVLFAFYVAHWEKYTTSIMFLPWAYDVSQIWLAGSYLVTYIYGPEFWRETLFGSLALSYPFVLKSVFYVLVVFFCIPMSLYNQISARRENPKDCKNVIEGLMPLVSLGSVTAVHMFYGYISNDVLETQLRLYLIAYCILYSNISCRLIIAQMSGTLCDRFNSLAYPLIPMIVASRLKVLSDSTLILYYVIYLTMAHFHYGFCVVRQLSDHINVYVFKVGKPPAKKQTNGHANGFVSNGKASKD